MRRLLVCAALAGLIGGLAGCDDKKSTAPTPAAGTGLRGGEGPGAPPPPPPPPPPPK